MGDKIIIDKDDLIRIADTVRLKRGSEELLSLFDIFASLEDNLYLIVDEAGNELYGTFVNQPILTNATPNDIRIGKTAVTENGLIEGENTITYRTEAASCLIFPGDNFSIPLSNHNQYDYTKFQCMIVLFSSDYSANVTSMGISVDDSVFSTITTEKLSDITKNSDTKSIDLNITNNTENVYSIRYFTYREDMEE